MSLVIQSDDNGEREKKLTRKKVDVSLGCDESGQPLPDDDSRSYTPAQKYVFDKAWKHGVLPQELKDAYTTAKEKKDVAEQKRIINSIAPKDSRYCFDIIASDTEQSVWIQTKERFFKSEKKNIAHGMAWSELRFKEKMSQQDIKEAIAEGGLLGPDKEGFYYWKRRTIEQTEGRKDGLEVIEGDEEADEEATQMMEDQLHSGQQGEMNTWIMGPASSSGVGSSSDPVFTEKAMQKLQQGHDALQTLSNDCRQWAIELSRAPNVQPNTRRLIEHVQEQLAHVPEYLNKMSDMLLNLDKLTTNAAIQNILQKAENSFQILLQAESELKAMKKKPTRKQLLALADAASTDAFSG